MCQKRESFFPPGGNFPHLGEISPGQMNGPKVGEISPGGNFPQYVVEPEVGEISQWGKFPPVCGGAWSGGNPVGFCGLLLTMNENDVTVKSYSDKSMTLF